MKRLVFEIIFDLVWAFAYRPIRTIIWARLHNNPQITNKGVSPISSNFKTTIISNACRISHPIFPIITFIYEIIFITNFCLLILCGHDFMRSVIHHHIRNKKWKISGINVWAEIILSYDFKSQGHIGFIKANIGTGVFNVGLTSDCRILLQNQIAESEYWQ